MESSVSPLLLVAGVLLIVIVGLLVVVRSRTSSDVVRPIDPVLPVPAAPSPVAPSVPPPAEGLLRINHPLIRKSVIAGLNKGASETSKFVMIDGQVYLNLQAISDPELRRQTERMFREIDSSDTNQDGNISIGEAIRLIQTLMKHQ